jgi:hypothetical protein
VKHFLLIAVLLAAPVSALAQDSGQPDAGAPGTPQQVAEEPAQQPHAARPVPPLPPTKNAQGQQSRAGFSERSKYDPGATVGDCDVQTTKESGIEKGLKSINRDNVDYGGLLAVWRIAAVKETIESIYFWIILAFGGGLIIESAYIAWLLRDRDHRSQTAGAIIAQLWNSNFHARNKALDAIAAHNKLVAQIDSRPLALPAHADKLTTVLASGPGPELAAEATAGVAGPAPRAVVTMPGKSISGDLPVELFEFKPTSTTDAEEDPDAPEMEPAESVPLSVKVARGTWERQAPKPKSEANVPAPGPDLQPATPPSVGTNAADVSTTDEVEALKLALQKATEQAQRAIDDAAAKELIIAKQSAQITTKDQQILAKDNKILSQRTALTEYQNKEKLDGNASGGATK